MSYGLGVLFSLGLGCAPVPRHGASMPRLLHVPAQAPGLPARTPAGAGDNAGCARAAFELSLDANGRVQEKSLRLLVWDDDPSDAHALARLWARATASRWQVRLDPRDDAEGGEDGGGEGDENDEDDGEDRKDRLDGRDGLPPASGTLALLRLDCGSGAAATPVPDWGDFEPRLQESLRMRRLGVEHLWREDGSAWRERDLDCLWSELPGWRRGPFLHDEVEGWNDLEPRLRALQARDGGFWVCRAARSSHMGQFVFLDRKGNWLAVARYWLGE